MADSARRLNLDPTNPRWATAHELLSMTYEQAIKGSTMIGTADQVTEKLRALQKDLGLNGILMELNCGGRVDHHHEMEALRLLCQDVRPRFQ